MHTANRLECVGEAMAHPLHSLLQGDPAWGRATLPADWLVRDGTRFDAFRWPQDPSKRQALAETIGADGMACLPTLFAPETPAHLRVAMNLMRLLAWWEERPKAQTRPSRFAAVLQVTASPAMTYT